MLLYARYLFICKCAGNKGGSGDTQQQHSSAKQQLKQTQNDEVVDELAVEFEVKVGA